MRHRVRAVPVLLVALSGCAATSHSPLRQATGATAQAVCNAAFVSRLDPAATVRRQLHAEPGMALVDWALRYRIDRAGQVVSASLFGGAHARAVFRQGRGCTLIFGTAPSPVALPDLPARAAVLPEIAASRPVIATDPQVTTAIDAAFAEPGDGPPRLTQAIVVVHRGRVIGERYAPGVGPATALDSHSLAKSIVNALLGILVRDGKLSLDRAVDVLSKPETRSAASPVTIGQILRMDADFGFDEGTGAAAASRIWYEAADTAAASVASIGRSARSDGWGYCNRCYSILSKIIGDTVGGGPAGLRDFAAAELFGPLGMRDVVLEFDQAGTLMGANATFASARDFARFGLLYLADGVVGGRRILPVGWVAMSARPTPGTGYGAGFWANTTHAPIPGWAIPWGLPQAPADAFFGRGHLGQYIVVVPSRDLVIVRMGLSHRRGAESDSVGRLTAAIVRTIDDGRTLPRR